MMEAGRNGYLAVPQPQPKKIRFWGCTHVRGVAKYMAVASEDRAGCAKCVVSESNRDADRLWARKATAWDPNNNKQPPPCSPAWISLHHP